MRTGIQSHRLGLNPENLHQILTLCRASSIGRLSIVNRMNKTQRTFKQLAAGTAAVILTFGAAAAAVAVNLGTASADQGSKVGNLPAAQPVSSATPLETAAAPVVPSTIYVDVTVPYDVILPPQGPASSGTGVTPSATEYEEEYEYEDEEEEYEEEHEDEDEHEEDHEEGREDDD